MVERQCQIIIFFYRFLKHAKWNGSRHRRERHTHKQLLKIESQVSGDQNQLHTLD